MRWSAGPPRRPGRRLRQLTRSPTRRSRMRLWGTWIVFPTVWQRARCRVCLPDRARVLLPQRARVSLHPHPPHPPQQVHLPAERGRQTPSASSFSFRRTSEVRSRLFGHIRVPEGGRFCRYPRWTSGRKVEETARGGPAHDQHESRDGLRRLPRALRPWDKGLPLQLSMANSPAEKDAIRAAGMEEEGFSARGRGEAGGPGREHERGVEGHSVPLFPLPSSPLKKRERQI